MAHKPAGCLIAVCKDLIVKVSMFQSGLLAGYFRPNKGGLALRKERRGLYLVEKERGIVWVPRQQSIVILIEDGAMRIDV